MKWIGQHIWDFISRFRNDVYLEDLSDAGTDTDKFLVVDTNNKVRYRTGSEVLSDIGGASSSSDVTGITLSGDSGTASDTSGNLELTIEGGNAITTSATGTSVTIDHTDTSSASSVNNSGSTVIQDITIDTYGHITSLASVALDLGDSLSFDGSTANGVLTYKDADEISVESTLTYDGSSSALTQTIAPAGNFTGYSQLATTASGWTTGSNVGVGIQVGFLKDDDTQALASGGAATWYGLKTDASDTASNNVGNTYLCGVLNDLDFASANGDFAVTCGIENDLDGGDTQYGIFSNLSGATAGATFGIYQTITDGGYDLYFRSSADNADHAYWQTGAAGATTIATVDSGATAANLTLDIHGDIYHDSRTGIHKWYTNGNTDDYLQLQVGADGDATFTTVDAAVASANLGFTVDGNITLDAAAKHFYFKRNTSDFIHFDYNAGEYVQHAAANANDVFKINVGAEGATTISTTDADTSVGHISIIPDGDLYLDPLNRNVNIGSDTNVSFILQRRAHSDGGGGNLAVKGGSATDGVSNMEAGDLLFYTGQQTGNAAPGKFQFHSTLQNVSSGGTIRSTSLTSELYTGLGTTEQRWYEAGGASTDDYLKLVVAANGATTLATIDGGGTNADLTLDADGEVNITSNENKINKIYDFHDTTFENTYSDDQGAGTILKYSPGADESPAGSELFFLHTDGTWNQTDADAVATGASQLLGVGLGASARTTGVLIKGFVRVASTEILNIPGSGAVDGLPVYVSTTAGHFDFTAPSGSGDFVRIVGYAIDDELNDVLIYFNPDKTWVEIA